MTTHGANSTGSVLVERVSFLKPLIRLGKPTCSTEIYTENPARIIINYQPRRPLARRARLARRKMDARRRRLLSLRDRASPPRQAPRLPETHCDCHQAPTNSFSKSSCPCARTFEQVPKHFAHVARRLGARGMGLDGIASPDANVCTVGP
jgi:hypothetical protein